MKKWLITRITKTLTSGLGWQYYQTIAYLNSIGDLEQITVSGDTENRVKDQMDSIQQTLIKAELV